VNCDSLIHPACAFSVTEDKTKLLRIELTGEEMQIFGKEYLLHMIYRYHEMGDGCILTNKASFVLLL